MTIPFGEPEHPGGSLLALYVVAKDPRTGDPREGRGEDHAEPRDGAARDDVRGHAAAAVQPVHAEVPPRRDRALVSPPDVRHLTTQAALTPWSAPPEERRRVVVELLRNTEGVGEGPCPAGGVPPFKPQVVSGTAEQRRRAPTARSICGSCAKTANRSSPGSPRRCRPGLTGNLTGIPFCPERGHRSGQGRDRRRRGSTPSCPAASEIGHTIVGSRRRHACWRRHPGKVYLAGPYHGAPLSIVSITSAKVGPFDLGTVVIRFALDINPITAQVEVAARTAPNRSRTSSRASSSTSAKSACTWTATSSSLNPTNCNPLQITEHDRRRRRGLHQPRRPGPRDASTPRSRPRTARASKFKPKLQGLDQRAKPAKPAARASPRSSPYPPRWGPRRTSRRSRSTSPNSSPHA